MIQALRGCRWRARPGFETLTQNDVDHIREWAGFRIGPLAQLFVHVGIKDNVNPYFAQIWAAWFLFRVGGHDVYSILVLDINSIPPYELSRNWNLLYEETMELTLHDISSIEIKTIRHSARKGYHWLKIILTDVQGVEHDVAIFSPISGPETVVTQTKK